MTTLIDTLKVEDGTETAYAAAISARLEGLTAQEILRLTLTEIFPSQIALSSSFGADSAVLLHMVSEINPHTPVIFLDTDRHFFQTTQYRNQLVKQLGLTNLINLKADPQEAKDFDPKGILWQQSTDACCALRKVRPLNRVTDDYQAWITGRKRHQSATRTHMPLVEWDGRNYKVNPLADWTSEDIKAYMAEHDLPPHPLVEQGYPSIGCFPCTKPVEEGQDARAGRWAGQEKTECGIHSVAYGDGI